MQGLFVAPWLKKAFTDMEQTRAAAKRAPIFAGCAFFCVISITSTARAAVVVTFYSHDWGVTGSQLYFPHAFVELHGSPDAGGPPVEGNYGFTAKLITPALLVAKTTGEVVDGDAAYVKESHPHLSRTLSDDQYFALIRAIDAWRVAPGNVYWLKGRNCVSFVADLAGVLGLKVNLTRDLILKPGSFLDQLARDNPEPPAPQVSARQPSLESGAPPQPALP